ncbi:substrate-binding domain-containing protein [uncultured Dokdonia sp.]|uniref:substrate-binding domain-containing protein n=1 Tax=uncultured Dokdonia sp. TaxID=575653 RepID=UPI00263447AF|nr:substrate-binding domain-containing protein [uncultured Dokdonia sp.]
MENIKIGGVPEHFNLPWHLALEEGLFLKAGVSVEWIDIPEGTGAMNKALRAKEIDLAVILTGGVIKDIANGNPSKILQLYVSSPLLWGVHVSQESPFTAIDELQFAKAAISRYGSGSHVMAHVQAKQRGWDTSKLDFEVVNTLENAVEALINGKADYFMWEHFTTKPIVDAGVFRRLGDFPTPWSCFAIAGHLEAITAKRDEIKIVLDVINDMTRDFKKIPSIDRTLAHRYEQKLEDIQKWLSGTVWSQEQITSEEINKIQSKLLELQMIEKEMDAKEFYVNLH